LKQFFDGFDTEVENFREHLWQYNRAFAFTSLGVNEDHSVNQSSIGPPIFRIQGELHHRVGLLLPSAGQPPIYAQLYVHEPRDSLLLRVHNNTNLRHDTTAKIQQVPLSHHQYAPIYKHTFQIVAQYTDIEDATIRLRVVRGADHRTHNLPTADEVAVVLPGDNSDSQYCDIVIQMRQDPLLRISEDLPAYTPLQYVLLFPYGDNSWPSDLYEC
jgi:hypothetical protein